jgi:hypothetical protein
MPIQAADRTARIRKLNDAVRLTFAGIDADGPALAVPRVVLHVA